MNPLRRYLGLVGAGMVRLGLLDRSRAEVSADLAWPQMVTALARQSRRTADLAMVGYALGPSAVAALGFAYTYWFLVAGFAVGTGGGTIALVAQYVGADRHADIDRVLKQSLWVSLVCSVPLTLGYWFLATDLVALLGADPVTLGYSAAYLQVLGLGVGFRFLNIVGARALIGADDAWSPMMLRLGGGGLNVALNAVLIFGLGMGVVGAAVGTVAAMGATTAAFAWGFLGRRVPGVGTFPVTFRRGGPYLDRALLGDLVDIAAPLVVRRVGGNVARFPFIALVAQFGPVIVAAYTVSRRMRGMVKAVSDGFGDAASSLVGRALGGDDERAAEAYGWDILRYSLGVQVLTGLALVGFARPIARVFVREPAAVDATVPFIWVVMVAVVGLGIDTTATGTLRAGGDSRWPMYGRLLGRYGMVPVVWLGTVTPLGVVAVYLALLVETYLPATVTFHRFRSGRWKAVSRAYRPGQDG